MTESTLSGLRIDAGGDQFPVSEATPRLSWLPASHAQRGYELAATVDDQPLAPATAAGHRLISWPWRPLRSGERVHWRVRVPGGRVRLVRDRAFGEPAPAGAEGRDDLLADDLRQQFRHLGSGGADRCGGNGHVVRDLSGSITVTVRESMP